MDRLLCFGLDIGFLTASTLVDILSDSNRYRKYERTDFFFLRGGGGCGSRGVWRRYSCEKKCGLFLCK